MRLLSPDNVDQAIEAIDTDGYALLESAISEAEAAELTDLVLGSPSRIEGVSGYEFAVCLLNHDQRFLKLAMHPTVLALANHLLGGRLEPAPNAFAWPADDQVRMGSVDGLIAHPDSDPGWWHMDSPMGQLNQSRPLPDFPILVNAIWALTPFAKQTGATRLVPGSQHLRRLPPATREALENQLHCCAPPGSVVIIPNTVWHAAGSNRSKQPRVAVACNYQPWWVGRLTMDIFPINPDVWEQLPPAAQALTKHQLEWNTDFRGKVEQVR